MPEFILASNQAKKISTESRFLQIWTLQGIVKDVGTILQEEKGYVYVPSLVLSQ